MTPGFWRGRRVLLTGHTGFKGAWLALWLERLGAHVHGLALPPRTTPNLHDLIGGVPDLGETIGDIADPAVCARAMTAARPEVVLHMAAQALVRPSYRDPAETYASNVMGTLNVLEAARRQPSVRAILVVTTDKVYRNDGKNRAFREDDPLGGHDPYSASKACCEILAQSHRTSFFAEAGVALGTARAGNVIGGGDWSEDRLIPDAVRALAAGGTVALRYPAAVRPWQHVLEPLAGYLAHAQALVDDPLGAPAALNFGPDPTAFMTVAQVLDAFSGHFDGRPGWHALDGPQLAEAAYLTLDSGRAEQALGWRSHLNAAAAIAWTAQWYAAHRDGADVRSFTLDQIDCYQRLMP